MSQLFSGNKENQFDDSDIEKCDNDDLFTFQIGMEEVNVFYSQLAKYSKYVRDKYLFSDAVKQFSNEIQRIEEHFKIDSDNFIFFFQLLKQNFNMANDLTMTYKQCIDLLKLADFLEVRKLRLQINKYLSQHEIDVDFIIQIIQYETINSKDGIFDINVQMENLLVSKISEAIQNEKFSTLPISIIYRVVQKSTINSDLLYDLIKKSINKFGVLFQFLNIKNLSENRLEEMIRIYSESDSNTRALFNYLKCQLDFIKILKEQLNAKENSQTQIETEKNEINDQLKYSINQNGKMQNEIIELKTQIQQLKDQLQDKKNFNSDLVNEMKEIKTQIQQLKGQLQDKEKINNDLVNELKELKEKIANNCKINGNITARIKNGLLINAEIKLIENKGKLNTLKSKYIISMDNSKTLGENAYNKGISITSLNQTTVDFGGKPGTYYIRAIVFDTYDKSIELVSNGVTTSGNSISFEYTGESSTVLLAEGKYKLEVWGAQGGKSIGDIPKRASQVKGGLGGYSSGTLSLIEPEKLYVFVGGEGKVGKSEDESIAKGGFPDGGSAKAGLYSDFTTVSGSGGGSTSIRIKTDSLYSRVIVAGGGGGGSGCASHINHGGFGGGMCGCNCYYEGKIKEQGAGTQIGSSQGYGTGSKGIAGQFGKGATNNYCQKRATGGGGGGGWYGGGSGGYGSDYCSGGGGGSGWIFTESSFNTWNESDPSEASQFQLDRKYYLSNASTFAGNQQFDTIDGNGKETGHQGNGFAKITPQ